MVFCNKKTRDVRNERNDVTILILIDGFLQFTDELTVQDEIDVTILILIDGFLQ